MGFCYFIKSKDNIGSGFNKLINKFKTYDRKVEYVRCNNAGENKKYIQDIAINKQIKPEFTSTETPQFNGVAERQIAVLKQRAIAMMNSASLSAGTQKFLWPEAIQCANTLYNVTSNAVNQDTPYKMFTDKEPKIYSHLVEFGRKGIVNTTGKFKRNWENKGFRGIMTGYATNKSSNTY